MASKTFFGKANGLVDDGFRHDLAWNATFVGTLEIPLIKRPEKIIVPDQMIPFSQRGKVDLPQAGMCFYEHDVYFSDFLKTPELCLDDVKRFAAVVTPDCSLYRDMPLAAQIGKVYKRNLIGHYLQEQGCCVVPNVRWGNEKTYRRIFLGEVPIAFLGVEKHSIVSIGTCGCCKTKEDRFHLREGLRSMLRELQPEIVLVYGAMPHDVFDEFVGMTRFVHYPDWTSYRHGRS